MSVSSQEAEPPKKRTRTRRNDTPYWGVRQRRWGSYVSEIRLPGQKTRIWLGSFGSPEMAARAHDSAAFFLRGNSARLNFPHSAGSLPRPESSSRRDIQVAAAKAAALALELDTRTEEGSGDGDWQETPTRELDQVPSPLRFESDIGELYCTLMDDHDRGGGDMFLSCSFFDF